jgi:hypothetical protein
VWRRATYVNIYLCSLLYSDQRYIRVNERKVEGKVTRSIFHFFRGPVVCDDPHNMIECPHSTQKKPGSSWGPAPDV